MSYIEKLETVNKEIQIENIGLKITEDSLLLSEYAKEKLENEKKLEDKVLLEIGAGQGIISILLSELKLKKIFAVEIQKKVFEYLETNIENNNLKEKIELLNSDIKEVTGEYDIIISNPPYKKINSGKLPEDETERISKYEEKLTLKELIENIKRLLKNFGKFFIIVPDYRLNDCFSYIYGQKLNVLGMKIIEYKKVKLIVIYGQKGGDLNSSIDIKIKRAVSK